jgi:hypothetical protein
MDPDSVYPVYLVLADLADRREWQPNSLSPNTGPSLTGLVMRRSGRLRVLLANVTADIHRIELGPFAGARARIRLLDAALAVRALRRPARFLTTGRSVRVERQHVELELPPYAYARVEADDDGR